MMEAASQIRIPRSLSAPDACFAVLVAVYLQYKQYNRRRQRTMKEGGRSSTMVPLRGSSLFHELLFTRLSVMSSPLSMASKLNAKVVDLQAEEDLDNFTSSAVPDKKAPRKSKTKSTKSAGKKDSPGVMEVRSRRIKIGELVLSEHFPALETVMNLSLAVLIGLVLRWVFGLIRSLRLSRVIDGVEGLCCSSFRGLDNDPPGSFERLLACVLIKTEGDEAGKFLLTVLLVFLFFGIYKLAWSATNPSEISDGSDSDKQIKDTNVIIYKRIPRHKVKRFFAFLGSTLSALWLFHTPALLRYFGLFGLIEAAEEFSARLLLLGNLVGILSIPENDPLVGYSSMFQNITILFLTGLALLWGLVASTLFECIQETARNAAFVLSSNSSNNKKKKASPDEKVALMNTRVMLIIQALAPLVVICSFFAESHFAESIMKSSKAGPNASFSKQYLQNSGQFVRAGLSWSFIGASIYTIRALLQSYLDQASTLASTMSALGEGAKNRGKRDSKHLDPFGERFAKIVPTAGKIAAFPSFVFAILACAHLRGGDIPSHPGVGRDKLDALSVTAVKGLSPPYSGEYAMWIESEPQSQLEDANDAFMRAASMSQVSWEVTTFRDSAHRKIADWLGKNKFCHTPAQRSIKSLGRHINYLVLERNNITLNENTTLPTPINGPQLLEFASPIPYTLIDMLLGQKMASRSAYDETTCSTGTNDSAHESHECTVLPRKRPTINMVASSVLSHHIFTPTVVIPIVDTLSFLNSIWWTLWYTVMVVWYGIKIRRTAALRISA
ncbi:hypothetical protein HJC23_010410 [Cyclotella cryptica]|uniref:Transmembrane protein n=1 Tax=Cyclotella cryptica TaxID=29204 RepID=A0ABD3QH62_9STRA|eukprot:CCRYP_005266-RA/>CCRYP_005266-RA protein AED:0.29 eAED:0.29 QI:0/-1/0/1/-1/1/1/0/781